jgi:dolichol-phosphate mannosyltransferase
MYNVILPTYNESNSIAPLIYMLIDTFKQLDQEYRIIVVDDNSPDDTSKIVKRMNLKGVIVIDRPTKMGLGSAYKAGLSKCIYPYTILMDSDLQHDPFAILEMEKMVYSNHDIITGTRYSKGGRVCGWSFMRGFISCTANNIAKYALGLNTSDLTGSFRLYKTSVLKEIIPQMQCQGFGFQMEIIARAEKMEYKIGECPIIFYDRAFGVSKMSIFEIFRFLNTVRMLYFTI